MRAMVRNPDGLLLPGMYVKAVIEEGTINNAVLIPQAAAFASSDGGHAVFLLQREGAKGGLYRVERRAVRLERSFGNRWVVGAGLKAGDLLVVEGFQKTMPGDIVKGVPAPSAKASTPVTGPVGGVR